MNNIELKINRGVVVAFSDLAPKTIALDGAVQGPQIDTEKERYSFDHHDNCIRLVTRSTCAQVMDAISLGFNPEGFTVLINDIDGDTVMSTFLLQHPELALRPDVRHLVSIVAFIDAHGPAYPVQDKAMADLFYDQVMAPEKQARRNKTYESVDLGVLLNECLSNLQKLISGEMKRKEEKETRTYEVTHTGTGGWVMAQSDSFIFDLLYRDGHTKAIAYNKKADGSFQYTVGKKSEFVRFPVGPHSMEGTILHMLNVMEPGWGGGSTVGGSPRNKDGSSSKMGPEQVFNAVQSLLVS